MTNQYRNSVLAMMAMVMIFVSCEDAITVDNKFVEKEIVVDAWLTDEDKAQTVTLTYSQNYFDSKPYEAINAAEVYIQNGDKRIEFAPQGDGKFTYTEGKIGEINDELSLHISIGDTQIEGKTKINRVPQPDSIRVYDRPSGDSVETRAEFYAQDFKGIGDTYWLKTWKNDTLLLRPRELTVIYDCTFDAGSGLDGVTFISPLRQGLMERNAEGRPIPYKEGDKIYAELHSISNEAFRFLQTVVEQASNGDNTIFAVPIFNSDGNLFVKGTRKRVLGFFNVASVSSISKVVE